MRWALILAMLTVSRGNSEQLRITVYEKAKIAASTLDDTFSEMRKIFKSAGIDVEIELGVPDAEEASFVVYEGSMVSKTRDAACRARRAIALQVLTAPPGLKPGILGIAYPMANAGLNVRVFEDRIRDAAQHWNQPYAAVLAHAIAHEAGHVLLRSNDHAKSGMMASFWGGWEYKLIGLRGLLFSTEESERMHRMLLGTGCTIVAAASSTEHIETGHALSKVDLNEAH